MEKRFTCLRNREVDRELGVSRMSSKVVGGKVIGVRRGPISQNLGSKVRNLNIILIALKSQRRV